MRVAVLGVALGSRQQFIDGLNAAYGGDIGPLRCSQLMHSHYKVVSLLVSHAFVSQSGLENAHRRSGPRGKHTWLRRTQCCARLHNPTVRGTHRSGGMCVLHNTSRPLTRGRGVPYIG